MILADKIINLRKKSGWSQEELAEKIGVSRQSISKWEGVQSIPDMNKILKIAEVFNVSTDYLLKDEIEEAELNQDDKSYSIANDFENKIPVSLEMANRYLEYKQKFSTPFAFGVFLCIISPTILILLYSLKEHDNNLLLSNLNIDQSSALGTIILLLIIAVAVGIFILIDYKGKEFSFIEKEVIETEYGVYGMVREKRKNYEAHHLVHMIIGVLLCIISAIPLLAVNALVEGEAPDYLYAIAVDILLLLVAIGVFLIVKTSTIMDGFKALLEEGDFARGVKVKDKKISGIYWGTVTTLYLLISFLTGAWGVTWIIWAIAGTFYGVILEFSKNKK